MNACGVDASKEQADFCLKKGLAVKQANLFEFLGTGAAWDQIFCTDVIEHLHKDEVIQFLEAAYAALSPGGTLVVRTGNAASIYGMYLRYIDFTHETFYTENSLSQLLLACGFKDVRVFDNKVPFGYRPKRLARWALLKMWRTGLRMAFALEVGINAPHFLRILLIAVASKPEPSGECSSRAGLGGVSTA